MSQKRHTPRMEVKRELCSWEATGPQSGEYWPLNSAAQPSEHRPESSGRRSLLGEDARFLRKQEAQTSPLLGALQHHHLSSSSQGKDRGEAGQSLRWASLGESEAQEMRVLFQKHLLTSSSETLYTVGLSGLRVRLTARLREMGTRVQGHPGR